MPDRNPMEVLLAARLIADFASSEGVEIGPRRFRIVYDHMGAVLADSVLQSGLNYKTVVRPRVARIVREYPQAISISAVLELVDAGMTSDLLDWTHPVKAERFERVLMFFYESGIETVADLRHQLGKETFCADMQKVNGVGPKTVDYMSCLVGIESIAVDRHIKTFATKAGLEVTDYNFLKRVFCFAADLLSVPRRDFDAWIWSKESQKPSAQLTLSL